MVSELAFRYSRPFLNRPFRWLLLAIAGIPITILYLFRGLVQPLLTHGTDRTDLSDVYLPAARLLLQGKDPYTHQCAGSGCFDLLGPFSAFQPPVMSWLLQPLARLDPPISDAITIVVLNLAIVAFILVTLRMAQVEDRQLMVFCALLVIGWTPTLLDLLVRQPQLILMLLGALWALGYVSERRSVLSGAALGAASALKLMQAPILVLPLWRRNWPMLAGATVAWGVLWGLGAAYLLPEYVLKVLPQISVGTGSPHNLALAGTIERIVQPRSFYGLVQGAVPGVRVAAVVIGVGILATTIALLPGSRSSRRNRLVEVASMSAAAPLLSTLVWPGHLVLEMLPILLLTVVGLRERRSWVLALALFGWFVIGIGNQAFLLMTANPRAWGFVIHPMAETGLVGQLAVWSGGLLALRGQRSHEAAEVGLQLQPAQA